MPGLLALVGGAEFQPGNEEHDALLAACSRGRPAYVICAAVRSHPEAAVASARAWFTQFGVDMNELPVRSRSDGARSVTVDAARAAGLVYLAGGDPGRTVQLLAGTPVWEAVTSAWRDGAALAGSSAGAMALCRWTLIRERWPDSNTRRSVDALGVVPACALLPHYDTFGERWIPSAQQSLSASTPLVGVDERTAALWHDGTWSVSGPGAVTVVIEATRTRFTTAETVLGIPAPAGTAPVRR